MTLPTAATAQADAARIDWQPLGGFAIARTETTVGQFRRFVRGHRHGDARRARRRRPGLRGRLGEASRAGPGARPSAAAAPRPTTSRPCTSASTKRRPSAAGPAAACPATRNGLQAAYTEQRAAPPPPSSAGAPTRYPTGEQPSRRAVPGRLRPAGPRAGHRARRDAAARPWPCAGRQHAGRRERPARHGRQCLGMGGRARRRQRQCRAPHARRLVVVWPGADACRSPAVQAGRYRGGLHRLSLRARPTAELAGWPARGVLRRIRPLARPASG